MWKVLANSTYISQKYRKQFSMQFVPVFMLGVLFESIFIKFPKNIHGVVEEPFTAPQLNITYTRILSAGKRYLTALLLGKNKYLTFTCWAWTDPSPCPQSQESATKLIGNPFSAMFWFRIEVTVVTVRLWLKLAELLQLLHLKRYLFWRGGVGLRASVGRKE